MGVKFVICRHWSHYVIEAGTLLKKMANGAMMPNDEMTVMTIFPFIFGQNFQA
jgi:hypothetical protein